MTEVRADESDVTLSSESETALFFDDSRLLGVLLTAAGFGAVDSSCRAGELLLLPALPLSATRLTRLSDMNEPTQACKAPGNELLRACGCN